MIPHALPAVFALLLLGAHFFRAGSVIFTAVCALLPLLLVVRRRIALRIVQYGLAAGVLVWLHTAAELTLMRIQLGAPWMRMLLILSAVALFTGLCVWLLNNNKVKQRFPKHVGR
jgi:hypothetical protein